MCCTMNDLVGVVWLGSDVCATAKPHDASREMKGEKSRARAKLEDQVLLVEYYSWSTTRRILLVEY